MPSAPVPVVEPLRLPPTEEDFRSALAGIASGLESLVEVGAGDDRSQEMKCFDRFRPSLAILEKAQGLLWQVPAGTPGLAELRAATVHVRFCINCAAGDENHCPEAKKNVAAARAVMRKTVR
jgi:hypothetical protein